MESNINSTIIDSRKVKRVHKKDEPELVEDEKRVFRNMTRINSNKAREEILRALEDSELRQKLAEERNEPRELN